MDSLNQLPQNSKIWIYASDRLFTQQEVIFLEKELAEFTVSWAAHSVQLKAFYFILHQRFIILAVDNSLAEASGCSIDTSVRVLKKLEQTLECSLFDRMTVYYQSKDGSTEGLGFADLKSAYNAGALTDETLIYDVSISSAAGFQYGWPLPLKHSAYYRLV